MNVQELPTKQDLLELENRLIAQFTELLQTSGSRGSRQWLRSKEVRDMLSISPGTLKTMRLNGELPYSRIGATLFYNQKEVEAILHRNRMDNKAGI